MQDEAFLEPIQTLASCLQASTAEFSRRYNLRSRTRGATPVNPAVNTESPEDFGSMVRHLTMVSKRNKTKVEVTMARSHIHSTSASRDLFSSDDN